MFIDDDVPLESGLIECDELVWPFRIDLNTERFHANLANIRSIFAKLVKEKNNG